ncbi:hypothetical protein KW805_02600 [Candidatus Pacearchaeota archaeon]|nr:hypothetical protein [Candidatus Pacearchaeota archaeon]
MINPLYTDKNICEQMKQAFQEAGMIKLPNFLMKESYDSLSRFLTKQKGVEHKIPDRYSVYRYPSLVVSSPSMKSIFFSDEFRSFLSSILGKKAKNFTLHVGRYGHKNYTLIHDSELAGKRIEFFYCLSPPWNPAWGGNTVYVANENPTVFTPEDNSFCIVEKGKDMNRFLQYINHKAGKNSFILVEGSLK